MKKIILFLGLLMYSLYGHTQAVNTEFVHQFANTDQAVVQDIKTDKDGNTYSIGSAGDTTDMDPGPGIHEIGSPFGTLSYVIKFDKNGKFVWVKALTAMIGFVSISLDKSANIYISGQFRNAPDFDPGAGIFTMTCTASSYDAFVLKLNNNGDFVWVKQFAGTSMSYPSDAGSDENGNIILAGYFKGITDFDPGTAKNELISKGTGTNGFVLKLSSAGNLIWVKHISSEFSLGSYSRVGADSKGNVFFYGEFGGTVDFDPGSAVENRTSIGSKKDVFILKLDPSGNFIWVKIIGDKEVNGSGDFIIDHRDDLVISFYYEDSVDCDPDAGTYRIKDSLGENAVLLKLDNDGKFKWAKRMLGIQCIGIDKYNGIYLAGSYSGYHDLDPGPDTMWLKSVYRYPVYYLSSFSANGDFVWFKLFGGRAMDYSIYEAAICLDDNFNIYSVGYFQDSVNFATDMSSKDFSRKSVVANRWNGYIHKLNQPTASLSETTYPEQFLLYPNPSRGLVNISTSEEWIGAKISVFNSLGQLVNQQFSNQTISTLNLNSGFYIVEISKGGKRLVQRLSIVN